MFRRGVIILSIVNLLLCPLACSGVLRCADREVTRPTATCNCGMCENSREVPRDPHSPIEKPCDSCQCLCGGAVCWKESAPEIVATIVLWAAVVEIDEPVASLLTSTLMGERTNRPPDAHSGRILRLELESLLC